jgi:hypothetical protein
MLTSHRGELWRFTVFNFCATRLCHYCFTVRCDLTVPSLARTVHRSTACVASVL